MTKMMKNLVVPSAGGRLDRVLAEMMKEHSRSRIQGLIQDGLVAVEGAVVRKNGYRLSGGENLSVCIPPPAPTELVPEDIPLDVLYEDQRVIVLNKPAHMVVHPAAGHLSGTLVHAILAHAPDLPGVGGEHRPGIVHRLDKDTSGVLIVAKDDDALHQLQAQFKERSVKKTYLALVDGTPPTPSGRVETPIGRDPRARKRMAVVAGSRGRAATTVFRTEKRFAQHTLLRIQILTGRTHQIRVHMAYLGCPVAADRVYGRNRATIDLDRQFLHAQSLTLSLPGEKSPTTFEAPLPADLTRVLNTIKTSS